MVQFLGTAYTVRTAYIVQQPPGKKIEVKTNSPSSGYLWIEGHWKWSKTKDKYIWKKGHWDKKKKNKVWVSGHWKNTPRGWLWIQGYWK